MSEFSVFETDVFLKQLERIPAAEVAFLRKKLELFVYPQLKIMPFWGNNIKKLKGYYPDTWRYRIGKFRLVYIVKQDEEVVSILTIGYRKDIYR